MKYLKKVIGHVDSLFGNKEKHFANTMDWLLKFNPGADEAMQIAAYAHDTGRALSKYDKGAFLLDKAALKKHQESGAVEIYDFLIKAGAEEKLAAKVKSLIKKHEVGGTEAQNLIKDADSVSYFEVNALKHIKRTDEFSKAEIKAKFDWMFKRITSKTARKIAEPFYKEAVKELMK